MTEATYVTIPEAAQLMKTTPQAVQEVVDSGRLRAIQRSERPTIIPRFAIDAYQARLDGNDPR